VTNKSIPNHYSRQTLAKKYLEKSLSIYKISKSIENDRMEHYDFIKQCKVRSSISSNLG